MATDSNRLIASLHRTGSVLKLETPDLCFLVALRTRAESGVLASFEEDVLIDVFEQICEITDPGADTPGSARPTPSSGCASSGSSRGWTAPAWCARANTR